MEWQSLVTGKRPHLTRAGGDLVDGAEEVHEHHDQDQNDGGSLRSRDSVNHLGPRLAGVEFVERGQIADVEHEGDDGDQAQGVVDHGRREDSAWQDVAGILQLFRQVNSAVGAEVSRRWSNHSDEGSQSDVAPAAAVRELGECNVGGGSWSKHPHDDDECEETKDVDNDCQAFQDWKLANRKGVERDCRKHVCHGQECSMP